MRAQMPCVSSLITNLIKGAVANDAFARACPVSVLRTKNSLL